MIHLSPLPADLATLQQLWTQTSALSTHSFFVSWHWIGTWLQCVRPDVNPQLLTVMRDSAPVALGLFVDTNVSRHGVVNVRTLSLNATSDPKYDCICTEYNGLLVTGNDTEWAWSQTLGFLSQKDDWDELNLAGVPPELVAAWKQRGEAIRESRLDVCRYLPLDRVRAAEGGSCVQLWSSRLRNRVKNTSTSLEARLGALSVEVAGTAAEAHVAFDELERLHTAYWVARGEGGSFAKPFFGTFHRTLIDRCFDSGVIQMLTVKAGTTVIAVFYNFVYQGRVSYYQGGVNYPATEKTESPGLLGHCLAIDYNARCGADFYDLMAGDSQYKRAITPFTTQLWWGGLQAPRAKLKAESVARRAYRRLRGIARPAFED